MIDFEEYEKSLDGYIPHYKEAFEDGQQSKQAEINALQAEIEQLKEKLAKVDQDNRYMNTVLDRILSRHTALVEIEAKLERNEQVRIDIKLDSPEISDEHPKMEFLNGVCYAFKETIDRLKTCSSDDNLYNALKIVDQESKNNFIQNYAKVESGEFVVMPKKDLVSICRSIRNSNNRIECCSADIESDVCEIESMIEASEVSDV